uniref:Uncharacterized protein n=1 Tax=Opuntia streptacantha TaxID=393608 RepID=A0A7C8ZTU0_OPUST
MITVGRAGNSAAIKTLKWQALHGSLVKRLAIRTLMFAVAISMLPLMQIVYDVDPTKPFFLSSDGCNSEMDILGPNSLLGRVLVPVTPIAFPHLRSGMCKENVNLTAKVAVELMSKSLLNHGAKALCIGQRSAEAVMALNELGFSDVDLVHRHPFFTLKHKQVICELEFNDNSFDFVIMRDLNEVSVPALFLNEVERILKPGGVAAMLVGVQGSSHGSLIRAATSVSSFLKSSTVVHVVSLGSFSLVAIMKRADELVPFEDYRLPMNCPSMKRNKQFMNNLEALAEKKLEGNDKRIAYLPRFANVPNIGNLVYIDMGVKEAANFSGSNWFLPSYPIESRAFSVYIVDHDALVLSSHVKSPGITFIYHPALAENASEEKMHSTGDEEALVGEDEFDFFIWFKETVEVADFVVLKMNLGKSEMNFLSKLFESGVICFVDELFLHCPESDHNVAGCTDVFESLRNVGVFVHQWWGN